MCGIFGLVTKETQALGEILLEGGKRLSYRGYDSVGCATLSGDEIDLRKDIGKIDEVSERLNFPEMRGTRGLIQMRWATFGAPSTVNAQPHFDCDKDMVGAHNGNVVNTAQLREKFLSEGHEIVSTNDGEICIHAIERYYDKGDSMVESIRKAYNDLHGDYAILLSHKKENKLYAIKKGSGLVIGVGEDTMYCSSDLPSILPLTKKIVWMKDGEIVELTHNTYKIYDIKTGEEIQREPEPAEEGLDAAKKGGYAHFMLKEIHEQTEAARELIHLLQDSKYVDRFIEKIRDAEDVYLVGCGTSYHACVLGSFYFSKLAGKRVVPVIAPQFMEQYGDSINENSCVVCVSQSGETKDVLNAMNLVKAKGGTVLGVLNVLGSTLMHESDVYLMLACGYEVSVPATKTFINQALLFLYLAEKFAGKNDIDWNAVPDLIEKTIEGTDGTAKEVANLLQNRKDLYYLGYGITLGSALEGALKLKEITYMHCEGMFSSEFKHGPLSAVEKDYPVLFITAPDDAEMMINHINEVRCRDGIAIIVAEDDERLEKNSDFYVKVPKSGQLLNSILSVLPLQLIAYHSSVFLGIDPDFPRNLSKTLTVD